MSRYQETSELSPFTDAIAVWHIAGIGAGSFKTFRQVLFGPKRGVTLLVRFHSAFAV